MEVIEIWINCPTEQSAETIGDALLRERLAACWNLHQPIRSAYHWRGKVESATEWPLVVKTRGDLFDAVAERVQRLHPYDTPSILGAPVALVNADYRAWIIAETSTPP